MADNDRQDQTQTNTSGMRSVDSRDFINLISSLSTKLRESLSGISVGSIAPESLEQLRDVISTLGQLNPQLRDLTEDLVKLLDLSFKFSGKFAGPVVESLQKFSIALDRVITPGYRASEELKKVGESLIALRSSASSATAQVVGNVISTVEAGGTLRDEEMRIAQQLLEERQRLIAPIRILGVSIPNLFLKELQQLDITKPLEQQISNLKIEPVTFNAVNLSKALNDVGRNMVTFEHNVRSLSIQFLLRGIDLGDAGRKFRALAVALRSVSAVTAFAIKAFNNYLQALSAYKDSIEKISFTMAQSSEIISRTLPSVGDFVDLMSREIGIAERYGLTFKELGNILSDVSNTFAVKSVNQFMNTSSAMSLFSQQLLQTRFGFEASSTAMSSFVQGLRGPVLDAFRQGTAATQDYFRALGVFANTRRLASDMGYSGRQLNNVLTDMINKLRGFNVSVKDASVSLGSWISVFYRLGDTLYMRLGDWLSVFNSMVRTIESASRPMQMFYGTLMGASGMEAYWRGAGFQTLSGRLVSAEDYFGNVTRALFTFVRNAVGELSASNALIYSKMFEQYLGLSHNLADRFTAFLLRTPEALRAISQYGLTEQLISSLSQGSPEIKKLLSEVQNSGKTTKEYLMGQYATLKELSRTLSTINVATENISRVIGFALPLLVGEAARLIGLMGGKTLDVQDLDKITGRLMAGLTASANAILKVFASSISAEKRVNFAHFQEGGIVPGPIGAPQVAVVHGGEAVLPAWLVEKLQQASGGSSLIVNTTVNVDKVVGKDVELEEFANQITDRIVKTVKAELLS